MSQLKRVGELEIDQDLAFQHREWQVQRVLWAAAVLLFVLALLGLFGAGPISSTTSISDDDTISVDYHRFVRHDGRAGLNFEVDGSHASGEELEIWLSQGFLDRVELERISPAPKSERDDNGRRVYTFEIAPGSDTLNATFAYRPKHIGRLSGEAGSDDTIVHVDQVSYP